MSSDLEGVAVIGLAARVPGACDAEQFWLNLAGGVESVHFPTEEELLARGARAELLRDKRYVRAVAQAPDLEDFDAALFGMTPREAAACDPQIRMFLETAHAAVENAGYAGEGLGAAGVFGASGPSRYLHLNVQPRPEQFRSVLGMGAGSWNNADSLSTLVAYKLNLTGPALTVQTACSSSLAAVHLAVNAIENGECDVALAGGAEIEFPVGHGYLWSDGGPWSRDGHCRPFDAAASGTVFSSGAAVVVLKRLSQAIADGDPIRAVIRGTAMNNDGGRKVGFTAPSVRGQADVIVEALSVADADPSRITMIEAHATGTVLGDPIEVAALRQAFERLGAFGAREPWCALTSVKSNVGHLGHAAGAASLVKTVLCLEHRRRVATVNVTEVNDKLELDGSPFYIGDTAADWPVVPGRPRLAGVTSLGVGGTNVHVVVEEAPQLQAPPAGHRPQVLLWSARTAQAVDDYRDRLGSWLGWKGDAVLAQAAVTLQQGRKVYEHRAAVVGATASEAVAALKALPPAERPAGRRPVTMLFPGQGAQHAGMARDLYAHDTGFAALLDEVLDGFDATATPVRRVWLEATDDAPLARTEVTQPLLFAVEYALARRWQQLGVNPEQLLGHSIGELTAAAVAGVFTLPAAVAAVSARAQAVARLAPGGMLAVLAGAGRVRELLTPGVALAVENGPRQCVVAGDEDALAAFAAELRGQSVPARRLTSSHAFHSAAMAPAVTEFAAHLRDVPLATPGIPIVSAATGRRVTDDEARDPMFWAGQLAEPVRFGPALRTATEGGPTLLLEAGPGRTLSSLARTPEATAGVEHVITASLPARLGAADADRRAFLAAAAELWRDGQPVDWAALSGAGAVRRIPMPGYRYQRERHWLEAQAAAPAPAAAPPAVDRPVVTSPFAVPCWVVDPTPVTVPDEGGTEALVLLPADVERGRFVTAALTRAGLRLTAVEGAGVPYGLPAGQFGDLRRVLRETAPGLVVDASMLGAPEQDDPHRLFAEVTDRLRQVPGGYLVLSERSADVSGAEPLDPARAALHALILSVQDEAPGPYGLIDLDPAVRFDLLAAELAGWSVPGIRVLRGGRRWRMDRLDLPAGPAREPIRPQGTYLITGGTGTLGLLTAGALAGTGLRPTLLLLSRTGHADEAELERIRALGATVQPIRCDLADPAAVERAVAAVAAAHGQLHGVFHLAGTVGSGTVHFGSAEKSAAVYAPKVDGLRNLLAALRGQPRLELLVAYSSWAAIEGQVGGADYAAANAWLDALASTAGVPADRVLSIDWPAFDRMGMTAKAAAPGTVTWRRTERVADDPVTDEHRLGGLPVVPGTGLLDRIVKAYRETFEAPGAHLLLKDVVFQGMLALDQPRELEVSFEPADPDGFRSVVVRSAPVGRMAPDEVQSHARGKIKEVEREDRRLDLDALRGALPDVQVPPRKPVGRQAFTLGPRWRAVQQIRTGGGSERLLSLGLPAAFAHEAASHALHPILMDCATTTARDNEHDEIHLPFLYRTLVVRCSSLPDGVHSYIRRHPDGEMIVADLDVVGHDGTVLVEARGFTMRRAADTATRPAPRRSQKTGPGVDWLTAAQGGTLLLDLLRTGASGQVIVRRHSAGQPQAAVARPAAVQPAVVAEVATPAVTTGESTVERVKAVWTAALGIADIKDTDDFFELGGNSLTAIELIDNIKDRFRVELGITAVFDHSTVAALAGELDRLGAA